MSRTTNLLQDVNKFTHGESSLKINKTKKHFIFEHIFINSWKNKNKTSVNKCFTFTTLHFSTALFCYVLIRRQSSAWSYVILNYDVMWRKKISTQTRMNWYIEFILKKNPMKTNNRFSSLWKYYENNENYKT